MTDRLAEVPPHIAADLQRRLEESLAQQAATADVLKIISRSSFDLQTVLETLINSAVRLCGANRGSIFLREGEVFPLRAASGTTPGFLQFWAANPSKAGRGSATARVIASGKIEVIADVLADPEMEMPADSLKNIRAALGVPMLRDNRVEGVMVLTRPEPGPFSQSQIDLVQTFADQAVIAIENTRLFDEVQARTRDLTESLQQQTATADVLKVISRSAFDLQPVLDTLVASAAQLCNADAGIIWLRKDDLLHAAAAAGFSRQEMAFFRDNPRSIHDKSLAPRVLRSRRTVHIPDRSLDPEFAFPGLSNLASYATMLGVPLLRDDSIEGVFTLSRSNVAPFTPRQIELVETFADQAVIAIENTRLFNETTEALERQTATADILKVIASSPSDAQPVFEAIATSANRLIGGFSTSVFSIVDGMMHLTAFTRTNPAADEALKARFPSPLSARTYGKQIRNGHIVQIPDTEVEGAVSAELRDSARMRGYRSMLHVPLLREGTTIGLITVTRAQPGPFPSNHVQLLRTFADQAVIAIGNVQLFDEVQAKTADLQESLQQQTATADVLKVISRSAFDLETVLDALLSSACRLCEADIGTIRYREDGEFRLAATFGAKPEWIEHFRKYSTKPDRSSVFGRTIVEGHVVHISDLLADPDYDRPAAQKLMGFRAALGVPLTREGETFGVINLFRLDVGSFELRQIELVQTFADQAVIAIENVRLFEEVQAKTRDLTEALEQQTATSEVLQVISSAQGELDPVFTKLLENATRVCGANFGTMNLCENGEFRQVARYNVPDVALSARPEVIRPHPESGLATAARTKRVVQIEDIRASAAYRERAPEVQFLVLAGARTLFVVPMLRDDEVLGTITIYRQEVRLFTDQQIELAVNFARQAVIAIENARLLNELKTRTTELSRSLDDLRAAQDRLVQTEKLASLGQLTAGIAHEIKNPLNFVNNFSALSAELTDELNDVLGPVAMDGEVRGEVKELTRLLKDNLEKVIQHGKRADSIVKNMLLHSRQGSGEHRPVDINAIVDESLNLAYHGARAENTAFNITMHRDFDPAAGMAIGYPQEITRALLNLISNGFYAATKRKSDLREGFEPTLTATTRNLGGKVEIRIRDNGAGIADDVIEKIFNPFFTTKPAGEGTGLGLSMSHDIIVKQHGGTIDVDTAAGAFTEFRIVLPRAAAIPVKPGEQR